MKKKVVAALAAGLALASISIAAQAEGETITMMMNGTESDSQVQGYKDIIQKFNETNDLGVTIECTYYANSDYKTALSTMMAADSEPGIIFTWELGYLGNYVNGGKILPLDSYLDDEWKGTFNDGVLDLLSYDGQVYGIPTQQCVGLMYYNKQMFADNGLEVPTTYEEFLNCCETLKAAGITPISLASTAADAWLVSQYIQETSNGIGGYELFDSLVQGTGAWNDPAFVEAATMFQNEVNNGYYEDGFTGVSGDEARQFFQMGMTAMYYNGSWEVSTLSDPAATDEAANIGCFVVPKQKAENQGVTLGSVDTSFALTQNCENPDAAIEFLKFWTNEENATTLAYDWGRMPCTKWAIDESKVSPLLAEAIQLLGEQKNMTPWLDRVNADLGNEFNNQSVSVANGEDPQACFDALQAYVESK